MKKMLMISSIIFCLIFALSFSAVACHFENVEISADCYGYTIKGEIWSDWHYHPGATLAYSFSLNGLEVVSKEVDIVVDLDVWSGVPFEIIDLSAWEAPCGDVEITGTLEWLRLLNNDIVEDTANFGPTIVFCPCGDSGCTPGYWKTRPHQDEWMLTGYNQGDDFDTTFGVDLFNPDITLYEAVWARGGGVNKLARHGTAALLSAAHPDVDYLYTVEEVIAAVQAGNADILEDANELGCPLD